MDTSSVPLIFIHYGDAVYLKYTLRKAKETNHGKEIILLGDESNRHRAKDAQILFYPFNNYSQTPLINDFNQVYKFVAGPLHQKQDWTKFVFLRWYIIYEFAIRKKIKKFWTFDSDTLILEDLTRFESKLNNYDCTNQCNGICMNGFISNLEVVFQYLKKIIELFQREDYLEKQIADFKRNPHFAFTEMRAYETFKAEEKPKTLWLEEYSDNDFFDDSICGKQGFEQYQLISHRKNERKIKKIFFDSGGNLYARHIESGRYKKFNTMNMSWVPLELYQRVITLSNNKTNQQRSADLQLMNPDLRNVKSTMKHWIRSFIQKR